MFTFQPEERLTMDQVLRSEWMVKWALPLLRTPPQCGAIAY